jgi:hypothetical protein
MVVSISDLCLVVALGAIVLTSFFRLLIIYIDKLGDDDYKKLLTEKKE